MLKHGEFLPLCSSYTSCAYYLQFFAMWCKGRAGVPMEVMGLMLGEFVDDYTVRVIDVFAMPQSGTVRSHHIYRHNSWNSLDD